MRGSKRSSIIAEKKSVTYVGIGLKIKDLIIQKNQEKSIDFFRFRDSVFAVQHLTKQKNADGKEHSMRNGLRFVRKVVEPVSKPVLPQHISSVQRGGGALALYLNEIAQYPLITVEREVELAKLIKKGNRKAREEMINANLRLVVKIASDYQNCGMPLLDLISEGNIGLMKAVERFDPKKGGKLSTYGSWWIKQAVKRSLANQSKTIRVPVYMKDRQFNISRAINKLTDELEREPTDAEIADSLKITEKAVALGKKALLFMTSLNAPIGDDENEGCFGDTLADESARMAFDASNASESINMVRELLDQLDKREIVVLEKRFGFNGNEPLILDEVGKIFGVTRERIRQIQNLAIKKLRRKVTKRLKPTI